MLTESTESGPKLGPLRRSSTFPGGIALVFLAAAALTTWGMVCAQRSQFDALPDLSDVQVIVATEWMGRSPTLIEDQSDVPDHHDVSGAPRVKARPRLHDVRDVLSST